MTLNFKTFFTKLKANFNTIEKYGKGRYEK